MTFHTVVACSNQYVPATTLLLQQIYEQLCLENNACKENRKNAAIIVAEIVLRYQCTEYFITNCLDDIRERNLRKITSKIKMS